MRSFSVVCLGLLALASATPMMDNLDNVNNISNNNLGQLDLKDKQKMIMKLLNNVMQPTMYKDIEEIGLNYKLENNVDKYFKTDLVKDFVKNVQLGMLPRGEIFTLHVDRQLKEVVKTFHMLYYAKDFETFIKTACWMRLNLNEGMFVYALTVACRHRNDCKDIVLPAPYEVYPYYFVRGDVIQKAYMLKMKKGLLDKKLCDFYGIKKTDKDVYIIDENVYDTRANLNQDDKLRYFTEDIDLNTYYYYFHVDFPFWMRDNTLDKNIDRRWEIMLYFYQQILARYQLERLSNGLDETNTLTLDKPVKTGYWPWLQLHNGVQMANRMNNQQILNNKNVKTLLLVEEYESIIKQAIIKGFIEIDGKRLELTKQDDIENLGKMIYGDVERKNEDKKEIQAYRYLLIVMKAVLGLNVQEGDKYFVIPTVLDQYQTALRDPVFYQLQKRLMTYVRLFKSRLPAYTKEEVSFPGVKIDNVVVDKLITYFDDNLMDITNALTFTDEELKKGNPDMSVLVRKRRLNNKPFTVTINVLSDKTVDSVVRVFLGPKEDNNGKLIDINKNRLNFVEIDNFITKLQTGKNTIVRKSNDMNNVINDRIMARDIHRNIDTTSDIRDVLKTNLKNYNTGFPVRLLLPKGRLGGLKMMLYVIVTPLRLNDNNNDNTVNMLNNNMNINNLKNNLQKRFTVLDKMPLGFPLDRKIDVVNFHTPNMKFVNVVIIHKQTTCEMKNKWERYVLKNYGMMNMNNMDNLDNMNILNNMNNNNNLGDGSFIADTEIDTLIGNNDNKRYNLNLDMDL